MLRTDTANFNRFLTSVGMLLLAAALVIPYFYFQNTDTLEIPASDLRGMTETGRNALTGRQDAIASLEVWVVVGAGVLAALGVVLVVWGGFRLRAAQESDDEEAALRKKRAELEVREMSPDEKAEQASEKAISEVAQEVTARSAAPQSPAGAMRPAEEGHLMSRVWRDRLRAINRISARTEEVFRGKEIPGRELKWQVRIGSARDAIRLDGVFEATGGRLEDVVLETRVSGDPRTLRNNAYNIANALIARLSRYRELTGRPAKGWLVVVIPSEFEGQLRPDAHDRAMDTLRDALQHFGSVSLLNEGALYALPEQFVEFFGST